MTHALTFLCLSLLLVACRPTWTDYAKESERAFQGYVTGDLATAKAALFEEERILAKHEAGGNRGVNYPQARLILYARLVAVTLHMGQTNEAQPFFEKAIAQRKLLNLTNSVTMEDFAASIERSDRVTKPLWRQHK